MKKTIVICVLLLSFFGVANAQDIIASTLRIGPFVIGQKHTEVEVALGSKLNKKELKVASEDYTKKVKVMYQNAIFELDFYEGSDNTFFLQSVTCSDSKLATKSGIRIGMDKLELIKKLDALNVSFTYSKSGDLDDNGKSKGTFNEQVTLIDYTAGKSLMLTIKNNVVVEFAIFIDEGGC